MYLGSVVDFVRSLFQVRILLCVRLKAGERQREARKFATTSCHGQPAASFASRSYHGVHDSLW